ncbi:MAG TPA: hypothetical protein VMV73_02730 [Candidatus Dormibacteraeota bacterium]|nr:hypothetical protein [Candidatus Dormibacteraeota bacterium]
MKIAAALSGQAGIDTARLRIATRDPKSPAHEASTLSFMHVAQMQHSNDFSDDLTHGLGVMADDGGTRVPGMESSGPGLGAFSEQGSEVNYLAGTRIPEDEIDNFNDAIDAGHLVALYDANGDHEAALATFTAAGLRNVKAF